MTEEQRTQAKKLITFSKDKELALFDELVAINDNLKAIADKEVPEHQCPSIGDHTCPEMPDIDMTETNKLLAEIVDCMKMDKPEKEDVTVTLEII